MSNNNDTGVLHGIVLILAFGTIGALALTLIVAGTNAVSSAVVWLQ